MTVVAEKVEQRAFGATAREIEEILRKASQRQVGIIFQIKRVGNNPTYTFIKLEANEVVVTLEEGKLMTVKIVSRRLRPYNQEHQTLFLAYLVSAHTQQARQGGIYGQPTNCLFEKL